MGIKYRTAAAGMFTCDCGCGSHCGFIALSRTWVKVEAEKAEWTEVDGHWYAPGHAPEAEQPSKPNAKQVAEQIWKLAQAQTPHSAPGHISMADLADFGFKPVGDKEETPCTTP